MMDAKPLSSTSLADAMARVNSTAPGVETSLPPSEHTTPACGADALHGGSSSHVGRTPPPPPVEGPARARLPAPHSRISFSGNTRECSSACSSRRLRSPSRSSSITEYLLFCSSSPTEPLPSAPAQRTLHQQPQPQPQPSLSASRTSSVNPLASTSGSERLGARGTPPAPQHSQRGVLSPVVGAAAAAAAAPTPPGTVARNAQRPPVAPAPVPALSLPRGLMRAAELNDDDVPLLEFEPTHLPDTLSDDEASAAADDVNDGECEEPYSCGEEPYSPGSARSGARAHGGDERSHSCHHNFGATCESLGASNRIPNYSAHALLTASINSERRPRPPSDAPAPSAVRDFFDSSTSSRSSQASSAPLFSMQTSATQPPASLVSLPRPLPEQLRPAAEAACTSPTGAACGPAADAAQLELTNSTHGLSSIYSGGSNSTAVAAAAALVNGAAVRLPAPVALPQPPVDDAPTVAARADVDAVGESKAAAFIIDGRPFTTTPNSESQPELSLPSTLNYDADGDEDGMAAHATTARTLIHCCGDGRRARLAGATRGRAGPVHHGRVPTGSSTSTASVGIVGDDCRRMDFGNGKFFAPPHICADNAEPLALDMLPAARTPVNTAPPAIGPCIGRAQMDVVTAHAALLFSYFSSPSSSPASSLAASQHALRPPQASHADAMGKTTQQQQRGPAPFAPASLSPSSIGSSAACGIGVLPADTHAAALLDARSAAGHGRCPARVRDGAAAAGATEYLPRARRVAGAGATYRDVATPDGAELSAADAARPTPEPYDPSVSSFTMTPHSFTHTPVLCAAAGARSRPPYDCRSASATPPAGADNSHVRPLLVPLGHPALAQQ